MPRRTPTSRPPPSSRRRRSSPSSASTSATRRCVAPISGLSSRAQKSEGSLATANETLLTTISQIDPIWIVFNVSENEQLRLNRADGRGPAAAAEGQCVRRHRQVVRRLGVSAPGPHQLRRHARQSDDRHVRNARRNPECRRRAEARPVRARDPARRRAQERRSRCRRSRCSTDRRASSSTSPARTRTARTSRRRARSSSATGSTPTARNQWVIESGLKAGDPVIVNGIAKVMPGGPIKLGGAPAAPARRGAGGAARRRRGQPTPAPPQRHRRRRRAGETRPPVRRPSRNRRETRPCSRASSSTGRSSRPSSRSFIVLAGLAAMRSLPIAQYPEIAPPVVTVQAVYPGASAADARADGRVAARERDQRRARA